MHPRRRFSFHAFALALTLWSAHGAALALDAPKGKAILTLSGKIGATNANGQAQFDLAMLKALPQRTFTTHTPWEKQPTTFTGPLLRDVLYAAEAKGVTLHAVALNDYKISLPVSDSQKFDVIIAHQMDGKAIPVRTKGPLFVVYPFDSVPELRSSTYFERSIWQLKAIEVE